MSTLWREPPKVYILGGGEFSTEEDGTADPSSAGDCSSSFAGVRTVGFFENVPICYISAGPQHYASLTPDGEVYVWESSESAQMGYTDNQRKPSRQHHEKESLPGGKRQLNNEDKSLSLPHRLGRLETYKMQLQIIHISCGSHHAAAVADSGELFTWGCNEFGQLGHNANLFGITPVAPRRVYSFGLGDYGALGTGEKGNQGEPRKIEALWNIAVAQIACGENHSIVRTVDNMVYTWGHDKCGQLGLGRASSSSSSSSVVYYPHKVEELSSITVTDVSAGSSYSLAVSKEGAVFSWGKGSRGQLGYPSDSPQYSDIPRQVQAVQHLTVIKARGGVSYSAAVTEEGKLVVWGAYTDLLGAPLKGQEQKFTTKIENDKSLCMIQSLNGDESYRVGHIANGDTYVMAAVVHHSGSESPMDVDGQGGPEHDSPDMAPMVEFRKDGAQVPVLKGMLESLKGQNNHVSASACHLVEDVFSSPGLLAAEFQLRGGLGDVDPLSPLLNFSVIENIYGILCCDDQLRRSLSIAFSTLLSLFESHVGDHIDNATLKVFLILLQNPLLGNSTWFCDQTPRLYKYLFKLPTTAIDLFVTWMGRYPTEIFAARFVRPAQSYISWYCGSYGRTRRTMSESVCKDESLHAAMRFLKMCYYASENRRILPAKEFYNADLCQAANLETEYNIWMDRQRPATAAAGRVTLRSLCDYSFIMTPKVKNEILKEAAADQKRSHEFLTSSGDNDPYTNRPNSQPIHYCPYCIIKVHRRNILNETIRQLQDKSKDIKKELKIVFAGEEAIDEGGVKKEFFQILVRDLFNVDFGMFRHLEETSNETESDVEYELVGTIIGLAIYNQVVLDVHLPRVVYKKLLPNYKDDLTFQDFKETFPALAKGLERLLEFEGDVEESLCLTFSVTEEWAGSHIEKPLMKDGCSTPVTNKNRDKYIHLYIKYFLETSISKQFEAFSRGFDKVYKGNALRLFTPEELELLVCGLPHLDFEALEAVTKYEGGYTANHAVVRHFWSAIHAMSIKDKKKFLFFSTGCDRAPLDGLGSMNFVIQKGGTDSDRLPVAHTCFNTLILPEYSSRDKLERKLRTAIENSEGFGLQ